MKRLVSPLFLLLITLHMMGSTKGGAGKWMARLNDATLITELSIPGTHDTGTGNGFTPEWTEYSKVLCVTQDCNLTQQLASGIRAFDLRPTVVMGSDGKQHLHIFHGPMKTNLSYEDAIHQLIDFVTKNPTEFIFVVMRHEDDGDNGSKDWDSLMNAFLNSNGVHQYIVSYSPNLTVRDMRGKILVMSRARYADTPVGAFIQDWSSDGDLSKQCGGKVWSPAGENTLCVQDYYSTTTPEAMQTKLSGIERMLDYSMHKVGQPRPLIINHTSGYTMEKRVHGINAATSDGYRDNAAHTNQTALQYIKKNKGATGLVMMDFAGVNKSGSYKVLSLKLTQAVIKQNFR